MDDKLPKGTFPCLPGRRMALFLTIAAALWLPSPALADEPPAEVPRDRIVKQWELIRDDDGIQIYRGKLEQSSLVAFKGVGIIDSPIDHVMNIVLDPSRAGKWATGLKETSIIRWLVEPVEYIEYNYMKMPLLVSDRDFVSLIRITASKDRKKFRVSYLRAREGETERRSSAVRGDLTGSYYVAVALDDGRTELTGVVTGDPKGWIPIIAVNYFQRNWPYDTLQSIRKEAAKGALIKANRFGELMQYFSK